VQRGGAHSKSQRDREAEEGDLLTEGGRSARRGRRRIAGDGGRRWLEIAGGGKSRQRQRVKGALAEKKQSLWLGRAGGGFLKREMGTPDSLQCLSGAHRTAHSSCPVNHRTAHREIGF
jgi:hypothetical protein